MKQHAIESYRDAAGVRHELVVRETADGGWHVLDLDVESETVRVIETLAGGEDGRPQAEAIARDYLTTIEPTSRQAGREPGEAISEERVRDADSHRRTRSGPRTQPARRVALPGPAR